MTSCKLFRRQFIFTQSRHTPNTGDKFVEGDIVALINPVLSTRDVKVVSHLDVSIITHSEAGPDRIAP